MGCHPSHWRTPSFFKMGTLHHQPVMDSGFFHPNDWVIFRCFHPKSYWSLLLWKNLLIHIHGTMVLHPGILMEVFWCKNSPGTSQIQLISCRPVAVSPCPSVAAGSIFLVSKSRSPRKNPRTSRREILGEERPGFYIEITGKIHPCFIGNSGFKPWETIGKH